MARKPPIGEANLAALIAAVIGSIGNLFALGIPYAFLTHKAENLFVAPILNVICFFAGGVVAWFIGGQLGPRFEPLFGEKNGYLVGGIIGGLLPVAAVGTWGWYLVTH